MRVTLNSQTRATQYFMGTSYASLVKFQQQVATGKRIQKMSDDPVGGDQSLAYSKSIAEIDQFLRNSNVAKGFMSRTNAVLDEVYNQIQQVRNDVALAANNASVTPETRVSMANKLDAIKTKLIDLANTQHLGRYIFSGWRTNISPVNELSNTHTLGTAVRVDASGNISGTKASVTSAAIDPNIGTGNGGQLVFEDISGKIIGSVVIADTDDETAVAAKINAVMQSQGSPAGITASANTAAHTVTLTQNTASSGAVIRFASTSDTALLTRLGFTAGQAGQTAGTGGLGLENAGKLVFEDDKGQVSATVELDGTEDQAAVVSKINMVMSKVLPPNRVTASLNGNSIRLEQFTPGVGNIIRISNQTPAALLSKIGLASEVSFDTAPGAAPATLAGTENISGWDGSVTGSLVFNLPGGGKKTVTLTSAENTMQKVADKISAAFADVKKPGAITASINAGNQLQLTQTTAGYEPFIDLDEAASDTALLTALGLPTANVPPTHGNGYFTPQGSSGILTINGIPIIVTADDTSADLVKRINMQTSAHGVTAKSDTSGKISLQARDTASGSVINLSASGGYTLDDIFGGTLTESVDARYGFAGDQGDIRIQTGPNQRQAVNMTADRVFNLDGAASGLDPDLFKLIDDTKAAVLSGNNKDLENQIKFIENASSRLLSLRVEMGGRIQNLESSVAYMQVTQDELREYRSRVEDVDITQAIVNMQAQQQVYQASLYVASSMFKLSLMDYL